MSHADMLEVKTHQDITRHTTGFGVTLRGRVMLRSRRYSSPTVKEILQINYLMMSSI